MANRSVGICLHPTYMTLSPRSLQVNLHISSHPSRPPQHGRCLRHAHHAQRGAMAQSSGRVGRMEQPLGRQLLWFGTSLSTESADGLQDRWRQRWWQLKKVNFDLSFDFTNGLFVVSEFAPELGWFLKVCWAKTQAVSGINVNRLSIWMPAESRIIKT